MAAPPADFQNTTVVASGLEGPSGFEIAPDGRIFILERTGAVKIYKNGQLLPEPFVELPSIASGDRGLIGIAFDPEFDVNCYVYFYYTSSEDLLNYLVRNSACEDVATDGPVIIYKTNSPSKELHVGGSIRFGADGKMYFAVGDNGYPPNGQDLSNPHGKILRINKDGTVPADNPFYGQSGALDEIWAYGFRNPWRFQFDPATDLMYGGDVGDFSWEEVNHIVKGGNYGWSLKEGYCKPDCDGTIEPIYAYPHNDESAAVTGGPVYRGEMFPEEYRGDLFFGDYAQGFIKHINLGPDGESLGVNDFDLNAGSVVDLKVAGDGSLYYLTYWPGRLFRITYDTGNTVPTANATADVTKGLEPLEVNFSSEGSSDPDGDPLTYLWNFGDGTTSTEANPTKVYEAKGSYTVELTVSDGTNFAQAVPIGIQVGTPPTVRLSTPDEGDTYKAGDEITYNAFAEDAAGNDLNDADIKTDVILHHGTHTHPFIDDLVGRANTFTIPDTGESSADTWYRIITTVTDTNGLTATDEVSIFPETVTMTFNTNISGIGINIDGVPYPNPYVTDGVINFKRELSAEPIKQGSDGNHYQFEGWSDGGAIRHVIATPETDTAFSAAYGPAPAFTATYYNNTDLSGDPVLATEEPVIDFDWGAGSPDPSVHADEWSARFVKDQYFAFGRYKFTTFTDDGVRLYIDGQLVIDNFVPQVASHEVVLDLSEGMHEIKMEYMESFGDAQARLNWTTTPEQPTTAPVTYQADYFNNIDLSGDPALSRTESSIDHEWGGGSPDPSVNLDNFSARWTVTTELESGVYEFTATADDGIRVYIDDKLVIDKWIDQAATTYTENVDVATGTHTIRVEYYEKGGDAVAKVAYKKVSEPATGYAAKYWNLPDGTSFPPTMPTNEPDLSRTDSFLDFDWGGGSPDPVISTDGFVAQWTKREQTGGTYSFNISSDDGMRVYANGSLIIDAWVDQAPTSYSATVEMPDEWDIVVEYYENGGGAVAKFSYELTNSAPASNNYTAEFWNLASDTSFPPAIPATDADLTRFDEAISFDWGSGSPASVINIDKFAARWTKTENLGAGTYKFNTISDDGVRLYVDGQLVIDQWNDHAATVHSVDLDLADGLHEIKLEYYENGGHAVAKLNYELLP